MSDAADPPRSPGERRSVAVVHIAQRTVEQGGLELHRPFPTMQCDGIDPFLLLDELGPVDHAPGAAVGAPAHPHRGFELVSYVLAGPSVHDDSLGNRVELGPGDVQLLTAGSGVVHEESPSTALRRDGGRAHGFQIWVNLAAARKMVAPAYEHVPAARVPTLQPSPGVEVRVLVGALAGTEGAVTTSTPTLVAHVRMEPGATATLPVPARWSAAAYVFSGVCCRSVDGGVDAATEPAAGPAAEPAAGPAADAFGERRLLVFADDGDTVGFDVPSDAEDAAELLFIAGAPLREPVARSGPFVMNDRRELHDAEADFAAGRFGCLADAAETADAADSHGSPTNAP